ncbi:MAG: curved DNA-binding protein CbpA [Flavobacteriales bacterium]|jgi:curved DNA-binding protein CbpA
MKDYFQILGLSHSADLDDVKQAYRVLAKQFHPDVNKAADAQQKFILVNEAYEFLRDDDRRVFYANSKRSAMSRAEQLRRDALYNEWVRRQQTVARSRAEEHAQGSFDRFSQSPIYKTAMVLDRLYNYLFLGIGFMLIFVPIIWFLKMTFEERERMNLTISSVLFSVIVGVLFTYGIYFFIFKNQD